VSCLRRPTLAWPALTRGVPHAATRRWQAAASVPWRTRLPRPGPAVAHVRHAAGPTPEDARALSLSLSLCVCVCVCVCVCTHTYLRFARPNARSPDTMRAFADGRGKGLFPASVSERALARLTYPLSLGSAHGQELHARRSDTPASWKAPPHPRPRPNPGLPTHPRISRPERRTTFASSAESSEMSKAGRRTTFASSAEFS